MADGLAAWGIKPGDRVAVIGETNLEWILADLGILGAGAITVTIYQSNLPHECQYILENSGARLVFCDTEVQAAKIREVKARLPALEGLICAAGAKPGGFERDAGPAGGGGCRVGQGQPGRPRRPGGRHPGRRAGQLHLHLRAPPATPRAWCSPTATGPTRPPRWPTLDLVRPDDLVLMFLPMAHSFAKVIEAVWFATGASCAFVESMEKIVDNAGEIRPTVMPSVPRIFEKAYNAVVSKGLATPGLKGKLFKMTMEGFDEWASGMEQGVDRPNWKLKLGRKLVFPKLAATLKERFGGRMRLFVSGGAPALGQDQPLLQPSSGSPSSRATGSPSRAPAPS